MSGDRLPYHCPTLNGDFFNPPCERQIAEAKEKRAKFPNMMLGFLEKCLECGGKALMQRPGAGEVQSLPEKTVNVIQKDDLAGIVIQKPNKNAILRQSILGAIDIFEVKGVYPTRMMLSEHLGIKVYKIDLLIKELRTRGEIEIVPDSWPNEVRKPGPVIISTFTNEVAKIITPAECEKEAQNIPEIFHEAPFSTEESNMAGVVSFKTQEEAVQVLGPGKIPEPEIPLCTRPDCEAPGSPVKIDKLGRSMGMCQACVNARGRRGGFALLQAAKTQNSAVARLDEAKYAELKTWLEVQAEENERTLSQEILYRLKMAMRVEVKTYGP